MLAVASGVDETRPLTELLWMAMWLKNTAQRTLGNPDLLTFGSRCRVVEDISTSENLSDIIFYT